MRRKARRLTASLLSSSGEFWHKAQTNAANQILSQTNLIYNKIFWQRSKQVEHYARDATSLSRRNEIEEALSMLEAGLNEYPDSDILLEHYLRICCERKQLSRLIEFINPTKKILCATFGRLRVLQSPPELRSIDSRRPPGPVRLTIEIIKENFHGNVLKLWRLADLLEHADKSDIASKIHSLLSKRTPHDLEDYLYGGVSDMRLGQVEAGFKKLKLGLASYPDSEELKSVFRDCCYGQLEYDRYLELMIASGKEQAGQANSALDFYRHVFRLSPPEAFIVKFKDAELNCSAADFLTLQDEFLAKLRGGEQTLKKAKLWLYLTRLLGLNAEFSERMFQVLYSLNWGADDKATKHLLKLIYKLTLPLVPNYNFDSEEIVKQCAVDAQTFAQQPAQTSEPVSDFGNDWAIWTSLFCLVQPKLYHQTLSAFEQLAFKLWPKLDYTAPHIRRPLALQGGSDRKIRIGFTVLDAMPMMSGLMERLDKDIFETVFLRSGPSGESALAKEWIARAGATVEYSNVNAYDAMQTIADQQLDILISGPCVPQIFFPLMARLAHLQFVLLEPNWPDGIKNSDYYISWQLGEPTNYQDFYKTPVSLLRHPPYWIERPSLNEISARSDEARRDTRHRLLGLGAQARVYICANTPPKIHPLMDEILRELLEKDPSGYLVFLRGDHSPAHQLRARLKVQLGHHYERVLFVNSLEKDDAHSLLLAADCCIDSFPICGMSSSFDGMMLGVPIVTLPTDIPFGRWTAAIYEYLGVSGLTATDTKEYVSIAMRLAMDKDWRLEKSVELREKSSLYVESMASFDEFQHFIVQAWRRKQAGLPAVSWVAGAWQ